MRNRPLLCVGATALVLGFGPSCELTHRSVEWRSDRVNSTELNDLCIALEVVNAFEDAATKNHKRAADFGDLEGLEDYLIHRANVRAKRGNIWDTLELPLVLAAPFWGLYSLARLAVVEDADSVWKATDFDSYVLAEKLDINGSPTTYFEESDPIEIVVRYLMIDNFTGGRLRDSLGGNGGEVSLQATLNALSPQGKLLVDDREFLISEEVKRRSPFLTALKATEKGRDLLADITKTTGEVFERMEALSSLIPQLEQSLDAFTEKAKRFIETHTGDNLSVLRSEVDKILKSSIDELRPQLIAELSKIGFPDDRLMQVVLDEVSDEVRRFVQSKLQSQTVSELASKLQVIADNLDRFATEIRGNAMTMGGVITQFFDRYGIDKEGLYENVEILKGLAAADRYMSMEFEGIRPTVIDFGASGTAAVAFCDNKQTCESDFFAVNPGVIYRGTVKDLTTLGEAAGFSLSILLLERDSDQLANALRLAQQYAAEKNISVGLAGTDVEASLILDALAGLAEKIAEDDVELKLIDLRFGIKNAISLGTSGREVINLRPCKILVTRNVDGPEFGAVAMIEIRRPQ